MSTPPRPDRFGRRDAARALDGTPASSAPLDQLLAAASAPGTETELRREGTALAAFQQIRLGPAHRGAALGLGARLATARVAVAGVTLALLTGGGVALAAGVGPGDGFLGGPDSTPRATPPVGAPDGPAAPGDTPAADPQVPAGTAGLSYLGLCRAFQAEVATNDDAAANPAFSALAEDAGSQAEIAEYCDELLGDASATPTGQPTGLPTGRPTALPTSAVNPTTPVKPTPGVTTPPVPTPTVTTPTPPDPSSTPTRPGGKPTKTPRP